MKILEIQGFKTDSEFNGFVRWLKNKLELGRVEIFTTEGVRIIKYDSLDETISNPSTLYISSRSVNERD